MPSMQACSVKLSAGVALTVDPDALPTQAFQFVRPFCTSVRLQLVLIASPCITIDPTECEGHYHANEKNFAALSAIAKSLTAHSTIGARIGKACVYITAGLSYYKSVAVREDTLPSLVAHRYQLTFFNGIDRYISLEPD